MTTAGKVQSVLDGLPPPGTECRVYIAQADNPDFGGWQDETVRRDGYWIHTQCCCGDDIVNDGDGARVVTHYIIESPAPVAAVAERVNGMNADIRTLGERIADLSMLGGGTVRGVMDAMAQVHGGAPSPLVEQYRAFIADTRAHTATIRETIEDAALLREVATARRHRRLSLHWPWLVLAAEVAVIAMWAR